MPGFTYDCVSVKQRETDCPSFVLFAAPVGEVLQWAAVRRVTPDGVRGPQRIDKAYKRKAIGSFFEADPRNTIPSAVVIGFGEGSIVLEEAEGSTTLKLTIEDNCEDDAKPGTVVDGQHRVLGMNDLDPTMFVNIVGLPEVDDDETAFQFVVINNKASRVSSDHLRALALHYEEDALAERLKKVRLNLHGNLRFVGFANDLAESPFKGILALPVNDEEDRIVAPAAIETAIGFLRQQKLPELVDDDDMLLGIFFTIWRTIKTEWSDLWNSESRLLQKVPIVCLTQFIVEDLLRRFDWDELDIFDPSAVEKATLRIVKALNQKFWAPETVWTAKGLDTSAGRQLLMDAIQQMIRNTRQQQPWYTDVSMVNIPDAE